MGASAELVNLIFLLLAGEDVHEWSHTVW